MSPRRPDTPSAGSLRFRIACRLGIAASALSRVVRAGGGTTVGGRILLWLEPRALAIAGRHRKLVLITGTNGKTTTRTLLVSALSSRHPTLSNVGGANMPAGLAMALASDRVPAQGVLEVDESFLIPVLMDTRAAVVLLLNVSRDQLDRFGEVRQLADRWRAGLVGTSATVIANADDPLAVWAALGAARVTWVATGAGWHLDAATCPSCGDVIRFEGSDWSSACGFSRPAPDWRVEGTRLVGPDGVGHRMELGLPGQVNRSNAAFAAAAAAEFDVQTAPALRRIATVQEVEGRYGTRPFRGRDVRLLLAKNPAGWASALEMVRPGPTDLVVAINARAADGRDPAWLWDVPFERWRGRRVLVTGERALDIAVRLKYAGVEHAQASSLDCVLSQAKGGSFDVVANYSAFRSARKTLARA